MRPVWTTDLAVHVEIRLVVCPRARSPLKPLNRIQTDLDFVVVNCWVFPDVVASLSPSWECV